MTPEGEFIFNFWFLGIGMLCGFLIGADWMYRRMEKKPPESEDKKNEPMSYN